MMYYTPKPCSDSALVSALGELKPEVRDLVFGAFDDAVGAVGPDHMGASTSCGSHFGVLKGGSLYGSIAGAPDFWKLPEAKTSSQVECNAWEGIS